jgi:hypothetical protein
VDVHTAARRLLAVPQSCIEHRDPYSLHNRKSSLRLRTMVGGRETEAKLIMF